PKRSVLPMHCSANVGIDNDVALFFGLSGTGKTTLSSDPSRRLIGDDEHGWSKKGIFNFEGGCYAKTIRLSEKLEPIIWSAVHRFGTVLENVDYHPENREIDFDSEKLTENTRAAYPLEYVPGYLEEGYSGHPNNVFFLTADAFGVMPPIALLSPEQAMYYFLSGYTAKLAGTEKGLGTEPQATFSTCFGAPFLPLFPKVYADLLGKRIKEYNSHVWLINTGWTGGHYGIGERINLPYTRAMIKAALHGDLHQGQFQTEPYFGLNIPVNVPGVKREILLPENTWKDKAEYKKAANAMVERFKKNFVQFEKDIDPKVLSAGPK
ncbi:MAG: phosphoenolpyruvate carboxykinase (ATP), partial [Anaerolineaceae bacterium]|nr:phosphoenolpyruvate carboxykinase (ATP) [Anaerolineaceae bacterium]